MQINHGVKPHIWRVHSHLQSFGLIRAEAVRQTFLCWSLHSCRLPKQTSVSCPSLSCSVSPPMYPHWQKPVWGHKHSLTRQEHCRHCKTSWGSGCQTAAAPPSVKPSPSLLLSFMISLTKKTVTHLYVYLQRQWQTMPWYSEAEVAGAPPTIQVPEPSDNIQPSDNWQQNKLFTWDPLFSALWI